MVLEDAANARAIKTMARAIDTMRVRGATMGELLNLLCTEQDAWDAVGYSYIPPHGLRLPFSPSEHICSFNSVDQIVGRILTYIQLHTS